MEWLRTERGLDFPGHDELWHWSVGDLEGFWGAIWDYFEIRAHTPYERVLGSREMPGAEWFPGARLNFAEHMLGRDEDVDSVAVVAYSQSREAARAHVRRAPRAGRARSRRPAAPGRGPGDRVVAYLPNIPETLVAFLATASIGAIWATCPPEFGVRSVLHRLGQLEPKVLLVVAGYRYGDKHVDRREQVAAVRDSLPSVEVVVHVPYVGGADDVLPDAVTWDEVLAEPAPLEFEPLPFAHPLYVLFSSGTTGLPKAIVHCHGGILLEHLKNHGFGWDLGPGDRLQWFTTTAWMMWNALVSTLLLRASIVMIDGNPAYPGPRVPVGARGEDEADVLRARAPPSRWPAARTGSSRVGSTISPRSACSARPARRCPLEGYEWLYGQVGPDVYLNVGSGGTDVCTGIVQGSPLLPVYAGEMSGAASASTRTRSGRTGSRSSASSASSSSSQPMPSMPVAFWNDPDGSRYREAYFDHFPGVWRFGDWIMFTRARQRRDHRPLRRDAQPRRRPARYERALLGRGGARRGARQPRRPPRGARTSSCSSSCSARARARRRARGAIRVRSATSLSPRHAPDTVVAVPAIPRTLTGKKLEVPVKRILTGAAVADVAASDALVDPASIEPFADYAGTRGSRVGDSECLTSARLTSIESRLPRDAHLARRLGQRSPLPLQLRRQQSDSEVEASHGDGADSSKARADGPIPDTDPRDPLQARRGRNRSSQGLTARASAARTHSPAAISRSTSADAGAACGEDSRSHKYVALRKGRDLRVTTRARSHSTAGRAGYMYFYV